MRIDRVDRLTLQLYDHYFPGGNFMFGAPNASTWHKMLKWCYDAGIECNRGRGTILRFHKESDVTAFMLRWS